MISLHEAYHEVESQLHRLKQIMGFDTDASIRVQPHRIRVSLLIIILCNLCITSHTNEFTSSIHNFM